MKYLSGGIAVVLLVAACGAGGPSSPSSSGPSAAVVAPSATPTSVAIASSGPVHARGATLVGPTGLVFDVAGNLYVSGCTWTSSYIYRIDPDGILTTFAGVGGTGFSGDGGPATAANLQCPVGMVFGSEGSLYFADHASNRIRRIDTAGIITTVAGSGAAGVDNGSFTGDGGPATEATLQEPWSVAFDRAGNLYIGDRDNFRVRRVDPQGVITTVAGDGHLRFSGDDGPATAAGMWPFGVAVDPAGSLVIADTSNDRVRSVDVHGVISTIVGTGEAGFAGDGGPAKAAMVQGPDSPVFDRGGSLYVQAGLRIRRIDPTGIITTVAGIGKVGMPRDGMPAMQAPFPELYGLAVDAGGQVYVADGSTTVYRIDTKGTLTVVAGPLD